MSRLPVTLRALTSRTGLRRTLLAYALFSVVEFGIWVAVILYAYAEGGAPLAGLVGVVQLLPAAVLSPAIASIGDRIPRGTALALAHLGVAVGSAATAVALLVDAPVALVVLGSAIATTAISVVRPIHFAALPQLARSPAELVSANSLSAVAEGTAQFVGAVLAGFGTQYAGPALVLAGGAMASLVATVLCLRLGLPRASEPDAVEPAGIRAAAEGLRSLWGDWPALLLLLVMALGFVLTGALDVLGVTFSQRVLGSGESGAGLVIGAVGIGVVLGSAMAATFANRRRLAPVVVGAAVVEGLSFAAVVMLTSLAPVMGMLALCGVASALVLVTGRTMLQRATDNRVMARVFAVQESTSLLGLALGAAAAPALVDRLTPASAFVPLGLGAACFAVLALVFIRRLDERGVYLPIELTLLRGVDLLAGLPAYALEQLSRQARWVEVAAGTDVVRQGEPGVEYFVVVEGTLSVTVDGVLRPTVLGPGSAFGEIALLRSIPRTATVSASTDAQLLALGADDFLAAVTGTDDGAAVAARVASAYLARDRAATEVDNS